MKNSKEELNVQLHQDGYFGAGQVSIYDVLSLVVILTSRMTHLHFGTCDFSFEPKQNLG